MATYALRDLPNHILTNHEISHSRENLGALFAMVVELIDEAIAGTPLLTALAAPGDSAAALAVDGRAHVKHQCADEDHADRGERPRVELLVIDDPRDRRDQNNPDSAPDGISDADRNGTKRHRQAIEGEDVSEDDDQRRQRAREAVRHFEERGCKDFAQYRER